MKNRKQIMVIFLAVAVVFIGVGFAASVDTLKANGTVAVNLSEAQQKEFDLDVQFTNLNGGTALPTGVTATIGNDGDEAEDVNDFLTFAIDSTVLTEVGKTVSFTVDIKNDSTTNAAKVTIGDIEITNNANNANNPFTFTVTAADTNEIAANGGTKTYTITAKLVALPTANMTANVSFTFDAEIGTAVNP